MTNLAERLSKLLPEATLQEKVADLEQLNLFLTKAKALIRANRELSPGLADEPKLATIWIPLLTYLKTNYSEVNFGIAAVEEAFKSSAFESELGTRASISNKTANNYCKYLCAVGVFQFIGKGINNRDLFRLMKADSVYNFEQWTKAFEGPGPGGARNEVFSYLSSFKARLENPTPDPEILKKAQTTWELIHKSLQGLTEITRAMAYDNPAIFNPGSSLFESSKADFLKGMSEYFKEIT